MPRRQSVAALAADHLVPVRADVTVRLEHRARERAQYGSHSFAFGSIRMQSEQATPATGIMGLSWRWMRATRDPILILWS